MSHDMSKLFDKEEQLNKQIEIKKDPLSSTSDTDVHSFLSGKLDKSWHFLPWENKYPLHKKLIDIQIDKKIER